MFLFLPFFQYAVYPILGKWGIFKRPLQKMVVGGILAALSFTAAGIVATKIEVNSLPILPKKFPKRSIGNTNFM